MTDNALDIATRKKQSLGAESLSLQPERFLPYVRRLAALLNANAAKGTKAKRMELDAALDGQPGRELRRLYTFDSLRNTGTYFTGSKLADRLVGPLEPKLARANQVVDPACGAGDLLVACARYLPMQRNLERTLKDWGTRLAGFDINSAFVEATRYRLALLALRRSPTFSDEAFEDISLADLFPHIRTRSGMENWNLPKKPSFIVVNPPFSYGEAIKDCTWGSGRISQAASFMDSCIENSAPGTRILAILPDVLRTGTRYERWRKMIVQQSHIHSVKIAGQFDELTQINVFLLELEVGKSIKKRYVNWARPSQKAQRTVRDLFDIRVGPVVPFRLDGSGSWFPYAHLENLPPWQTAKALNQHIRFNGTIYSPPLVTIRRTSRSDSPFRCVGTIVTGKNPIAIENHLLIALPHDKKVETCKKLLTVLKLNSTSKWMNKRICCRHLTVSSIADLPWCED